MMRRRRVVITGLGVVACNGIGKEQFWHALERGVSGITTMPALDADEVACRVAGRVTHFDVAPYAKPRKRGADGAMSRVSQFAVACVAMALRDAGIDAATLSPRRTGICYGTTTGKPDFENDAVTFRTIGASGLDPSAWSEFSPHAPASHIAAEFGLSGPISTCAAGCCTGLMVAESAANHIAEGRVDTMILGSADSVLSPLLLAGLGAGKILTQHADPAKASRPYDLERDGLVPGEGAGALVMESLESACRRNAHVYAEYLGYGCAMDTTNGGERIPRGGLSRAIGEALENAGLAPDQIDGINAQGLSHPILDRLETEGFKSALGPAAYRMPVTSIKSMTGAGFSADGMFQIISSCFMLEHHVVPPILNLATRDPACDLDYVVGRARTARVRRVLTSTRALGGTNAVVILGRVDPSAYGAR
jgi:3-oxoacyl-[acyl-carrier-protein] synthase II